MEREKIIYALRCASSEPTIDCIGSRCPYYYEEEITEPKFYALADKLIDGKYYAECCDADRICRDAADMLEGKM